MNKSPSIDVSIVIPFLNEMGSLVELHSKINDVFTDTKLTYELIMIDDGSTDNSNGIVRELRTKNEAVRLITFRRNQGKSAALSVGFQESLGKYVITMDADLQDEPAEIPNLIDHIEQGFDLVSGWKKIRHDPVTKTLPSLFFNFVTSKLSGISLHDFNCGLKIYRREVVEEMAVYGERHRFLPVLAHMQGFKVGEIPVVHHPRLHGETKFGAYRFIAGFFDLITLLFRMKFLTKPLHLFGSLGLVSLLGGLAIITYLSVGWFNGIWIGNRPLLLIGVLGVITGIQLFTLGLLAEIIVERTHRNKLPLREDSDINSPEGRNE